MAQPASRRAGKAISVEAALVPGLPLERPRETIVRMLGRLTTARRPNDEAIAGNLQRADRLIILTAFVGS